MAKIEKGFLAKLKKMLISLEAVRTTDGKDLMVDGALEVGKDILIDNEGEYEPAPSGEYDIGDRIIVVEAGRITEMREKEEPEEDPKPEPDRNNENMGKQRFNRTREAYEQTYEERIRKIAAAIVTLGYSEYGYIVEASDEHAVWCYWDEANNEEHFVRFTLSWSDEFVTASEPVEVVPSFRPKDEPEPEAMKAELEQLKEENANLKLAAVVPPAAVEAEDEANKGSSLANKLINAAHHRQ